MASDLWITLLLTTKSLITGSLGVRLDWAFESTIMSPDASSVLSSGKHTFSSVSTWAQRLSLQGEIWPWIGRLRTSLQGL